MARTNGRNIISEPWVLSDGYGKASGMHSDHDVTSPIFKGKKSSLHPRMLGNPEEVEIASPSKAFKTGMNGILSDLIEHKASNKKHD